MLMLAGAAPCGYRASMWEEHERANLKIRPERDISCYLAAVFGQEQVK
jgi:hypothetical protein